MSTFEPPKAFSFDTPALWRGWRKQFRLYATVTRLTADRADVQVSSLLYAMGPQAVTIYETFAFPSDPPPILDVVLGRFDDYFMPRCNVIHERAMFNQRYQLAGESVESFVRHLHDMAAKCAYGAMRDELIRDRLVVGISDKALSQELQLSADLTLAAAILKARQTEQVKSQLALQHPASTVLEVRERPIANAPQQPASSAFEVRQRLNERASHASSEARKEGGDACRNCNLHHAPSRCPARDRRCNSCQKYGHFSVCCRSSSAVRPVTRKYNVKEVVLPRADDERFTVDAVTRAIGSQPVAPWG